MRLLSALAMLAMLMAGCRGEAERARGGADPQPAPGGALEDRASAPPAAPPAAPPRPRALELVLGSAPSDVAPALPEPVRAPSGLVASALPGAGAFVALFDAGALRSWTLDVAGTAHAHPPVGLSEAGALVEAYSCGALAWGEGLAAAVVLRRRPGGALEPVLVVPGQGDAGQGALVELGLPAGWTLSGAGGRACAAVALSGPGAFALAVVREDASAGLLRYAGASEGAPSRLEPVSVGLPEAVAQLSLDVEPAFAVAAHGSSVLLGARGRAEGENHYVVLELDAGDGRVLRSERVASHARRAVLGAPGWREGVAGAWVARFDEASALEVAHETAQLAWHPLGADGAQAPLAQLPGGAWTAPVEALEVGGASWLLLSPVVASQMPSRLAALVAPGRPDEVVALVEAPVREATSVAWGAPPHEAVLIVAVRGGDGPATGDALVLRWFWPQDAPP